jgi:subfamily B ATP-binding cassette protein HlyB/CyaB
MLGVQLFKHLMTLPLSYFENRKIGETIARMRELETVRQFITGSGIMLILDLFFLVVFLVVMFLFSPFLSLIVLVALPFLFCASFFITPFLHDKLQDKYTSNAGNQSFLVETLGGIETIKAAAAEPRIQEKWENRLTQHVKNGFRSSHLANLISQSTTLVSKMLSVLLLWFGAKEVLAGNLTVGQLIAFNMLSSRAIAPILRLSQIWKEFQQVKISIARIGDIFNCPGEPGFDPHRVTLPAIVGNVAFDRVSFRYRPEGLTVLNEVSFSVAAGEVIGIVGSTGSGKTTLAKLLQRLYVPERGRVLIDGVDLSMADASWLRRQIGVVVQDSVLFNSSIRDNITLNAPELEIEAVIEAAKLAGAHSFIMELQHGYDSPVGERGVQLSTGQRQRLAIARALATNPRMLIFDEATSALDYESELVIQRNMKEICQGRTVFIIAHRLSTVRHADRIITLEKGIVVENNTPEILLTLGGRYATLHNIQEGIYA